MHELLTPAEMDRADHLAISIGPRSGFDLMGNAGRAVAREILNRFGEKSRVDVLCGPGNNGGDGYVIASELLRSGMQVSVYALSAPKPGSDAKLAVDDCLIEARPISDFSPEKSTLVVDALFGAGLRRPLSGAALDAVRRTKTVGCPVVAVDLPSGLSGDSGKIFGEACPAELTVTFFRKKPGHLLFPGRQFCGELVLVDIDIPDRILSELKPACFENIPALWRHQMPDPAIGAHKYSRGAVGVFSGGPSSTGAARLAAMAAQRSGVGAVTVYSPASALQVNACHLTSIMLSRLNTVDDLGGMLTSCKCSAFVLGPGFGVGEKARDFATVLLGCDSRPMTLVLDADGLTSFADEPSILFDRPNTSVGLVLTPHEGEFARLFPDLSANKSLSKLDRARQAAERSKAVVVCKGPDTVIASPGSRAAINTNGSPWLATAGSGDVLAGIIASLAAQGMPTFEAASAAVWLHGETGMIAGRGAIAEDLVQHIPAAFTEID